MGRTFPLLDGSALDNEESLDFSPHTDVSKRIFLDPSEEFINGSLPGWLSYSTDNGPANPTFNGVSGTNNGGITLKTGTTSTGDITTLDGPTVKWDEWTAVRFYLADAKASMQETTGTAYVMLADNRDPSSVTEGFIWSFPDYSTQNQGTYFHSVSGGSKVVGAKFAPDADAQSSLGTRIFSNEGYSTYNAHLSIDAGFRHPFAETQFPAKQDLTFHIGIKTTDTSADRSLTFRKLAIELV